MHVITTIERGGAENAVFTLAKVQLEKGYEVTVIPLKGRLELLDSMQNEGISVDSSFNSKNFLIQVYIMRKKYQGTYTFHSHLPRAELLIRLSKSRSNFYLTRHNAERFFPKSSRLVSIALSRFITGRSRGVICISHAVEDFLISSKEITVRTRRTVIYYGYMCHLSSSQPHQNANTSSQELTNLISIGRLTAQKNLMLMIDFAQKLKTNSIRFQLQIVGEGPDSVKLRERVVALNLEDEVKFLGKVEDVFTLLCSQDFFVFTSNYEGLGLALLEAMDAELPIIAPNNSAIPEVIGVNHPGLFESGNLDSFYETFIRLFNDPSLQRKVLKIQAQKLRTFDIETYFQSHHSFYGSA